MEFKPLGVCLVSLPVSAVLDSPPLSVCSVLLCSHYAHCTHALCDSLFPVAPGCLIENSYLLICQPAGM